jgi:hypothetical protein
MAPPPEESRRNDEQGFARTTISVPAALKARMERVTANWSAVASEAFERHLKQQNLPEVPMSEDEAIERLRRLKDAHAHAGEAGTALGRRWAMADAHPDELERLQGYFERRIEPRGKPRPDLGHKETMSFVRDVAAAVTGVTDPERQDEWKRFWKERSGFDIAKRPTAADVYGFCDGAVRFWRGVKDKL